MKKFLTLVACAASLTNLLAHQEITPQRQALTDATRNMFAMPFDEITQALKNNMANEATARCTTYKSPFRHMTVQEAGYARFTTNLLREAMQDTYKQPHEQEVQTLLTRTVLRTFVEVSNISLQEEKLTADDIASKFEQAEFNAQEAQEFLALCQTKRDALAQAEPSELNNLQIDNLSTFIEKLQILAEQKEAVDADSLVADAQDQAEKEATPPSSSEQA